MRVAHVDKLRSHSWLGVLSVRLILMTCDINVSPFKEGNCDLSELDNLPKITQLTGRGADFEPGSCLHVSPHAMCPPNSCPPHSRVPPPPHTHTALLGATKQLLYWKLLETKQLHSGG